MKIRFRKIAILLFLSVLLIPTIHGGSISTLSKASIGQTITVTVDFGENIAAYDSYELIYNDKALEYVSGDELNDLAWYDTSHESKGIRYKAYKFRVIASGVSVMEVKAKGVVSANSTLDELGDMYFTKRIDLGQGLLVGDINCDLKVNADDAAIVIDKFKNNNITQTDLLVCDLHNDNKLNADDAALIIDKFKNN